MQILQICPPHLSDVVTVPWEIQNSHFSTLLFIYLILFTLPQKKTNSNCCTTALLLFSASYYLHSPSTASWACYSRSACIDTDIVVTWAEFQHSMVYYATDQCQKRLEACINAEHGHSEHLLWHCLPDIPVATYHNRFFSEPLMTAHNWLSLEPPTFERT